MAWSRISLAQWPRFQMMSPRCFVGTGIMRVVGTTIMDMDLDIGI
jgi:hypothetical protein